MKLDVIEYQFSDHGKRSCRRYSKDIDGKRYTVTVPDGPTSWQHVYLIDMEPCAPSEEHRAIEVEIAIIDAATTGEPQTVRVPVAEGICDTCVIGNPAHE